MLARVIRDIPIERPHAAGGTMQCVGDAAHALPFDDPETFAEIIRKVAEPFRASIS